MSREIEFRAWDKETKNLLGYEYFNTCFNNGFYYTNSNIPEDERICQSEFSKPPILRPEHPIGQLLREQCSGVKDITGKKIYEKDFLKCPSDFLWLVSFDDRGCFIAHHPNEQSDCVLLDDYDFEIIRYIHKNPELLGESL